MAEQEKNSGLDTLGRKILSLFIKEESAAAPAATAPVNAPPAARPAPAPIQPIQQVPQAPSATGGNGTVDNKFVEHLASVLAKSNPQGPDYFEFREALKNLANLDLSEDKQYQAAWASFKAMGGSPDVSLLVNSANQYLTALNADREAFAKTVDGAMNDRVGGLSNEQNQLKAENEQLAKQILELQKRIDTNNERLTKIGGELEEQRQRILQNRDNYEATLAVFVGQIKRDLLKLGEYIK
ncbi:hypothetical protein [Larkinella soli]|uniref:hypothetical protein n=1 Tax=Larkinella soli TaxID=1770527 RepID=UPI000FFC40EB|nr:hypothetical protein [Larkinella soli]